MPLFARSFPGARVVGKASPPHPSTPASLNVLANDRALDGLDYQSPAGGLARWLRPASRELPAAPRPPRRRAGARRRTGRAGWPRWGPGLKVGFSWRSNNLQGDRALHFAELERWAPIFRVPGVHFVCLQYDECRAELARAAELAGTPLHAFPEVDLFNDLDEAAALTQALDLVISAPTAVSLLCRGTRRADLADDLRRRLADTRHRPQSLVSRDDAVQARLEPEWDEILELVAQRLSEVAVQRLRELDSTGESMRQRLRELTASASRDARAAACSRPGPIRALRCRGGPRSPCGMRLLVARPAAR